MFQGSPECQMSIINLLIPVVPKVKFQICGSMDWQPGRREDGGWRRLGETGGGLRSAGEVGAALTPEVHVTEVSRVERAMMAEIRCLLTVLNCHVCWQQLLKNDHTSRLIFRSRKLFFLWCREHSSRSSDTKWIPLKKKKKRWCESQVWAGNSSKVFGGEIWLWIH